MRQRIIIGILLSVLFLPLTTKADSPDDSELQITYTNAYTSPFDFEPLVIPTASPSQTLTIAFGVPEINFVGKIVTTTFALIDQYEILGIMFVILLAIFVLRWLFKFVTDMPARGEQLNITTAIDDYYDLQRLGLENKTDDDEQLDELLQQSRGRQQRARNLIRFWRR